MRLLLRLTALILSIAALLVAVLSVSSVQTRILNRYLAAQGLPLEVTRASIGWAGTRLEGVRLQNGETLWRFPQVEAEISLRDIVMQRAHFGRLLATEFTGELVAAPPQSGDSRNFTPQDSLRLGIEAARDLFKLPFPIEVADLQGQGRMEIRPQGVTGQAVAIALELQGKVGAAQQSRLELRLRAQAPDGEGGTVDLQSRSNLVLKFRAPAEMERITLTSQVSATGARFPNGAVLSLRMDLGNDPEGLSMDVQAYGAGDSDRRELLNVRAGTDKASDSVKGRWVIDLNQSDLRPYSLGITLPPFNFKGNGGFVIADGLRLAGEWEVDLPNPGLVDARLNHVGECRLRGVFDAQRLRDRWRIHRATTRAASGPVLIALQLMQTADWYPERAQWQVANPEGDVFSLEWQGLGADVLRPFTIPFQVEGRLARGGLSGRYLNGTWALRSQRLQEVQDLVWYSTGRPVSAPLDVQFDFEALHSSSGWKLDFTRAAVASRGARIATCSLALGQPKPGLWQAQATADVEAAALGSLWRSEASKNFFSAGLMRTKLAWSSQGNDHWQAQFDISTHGLQSNAGASLADLTTSARVDSSGPASLDLELPLVFSEGGTKSDLLVLTHVAHWRDKPQIETIVTSRNISAGLAVGWWQAYQSLVPPLSAGNQPTPRSGPFWQGLQGQVKVALNAITLPQRELPLQVEFMGQIDSTHVTVDQAKVVSGDGSSASFRGEIHHDASPSAEVAYHFAGVGQAREFDPAPYLSLVDRSRPPVMEGRFDVDLTFKGSTNTLTDALHQTQASLVLTGRGGKFHAFDEAAGMADFNRLTGANSRFALLVGKATSLFTKIDKRINAGNAFMRRLAAVSYDQATFELFVRPGQEIDLREFSLISPDLRLVGHGSIGNEHGVAWPKRKIKLNAVVSVRGQNENDLRTLGLLGDKSDALGYFSLDRALEFDGTVRDIATKSLSELIASAIEK